MNDTQTVVAGPTLLPFIPLTAAQCPSCDRRLTLWDHVLGYFKGMTVSVANYRYCPGGKEPTEQVGGLAQLVARGSNEVVHECAGIGDPHLHAQCRGCGYCWLQRTKAL